VDGSLSILLIALVGSSPASTAVDIPPVAAPKPARRHIDALVIDASTTERDALADALRLRIGERPISDSLHARNPRAGELFAYVEVHPRGASSLLVRLVLSDARAYVRVIDSSADLRARELATAVANLVAGIEEDDLPPDERDVALPAVLEPAPPREPEPRPQVAVPVPRYELGIAGGADVLLGLGPPPPAGFAAAGAHARVDARLRSGALLGLALRGLGHRRLGYGLTRLRIAIEGGYAWRRGAFELATTVGATVEPWLVTRDGGIPELARRRPVDVALGGLVRIAPAWRRETRGGRSIRLAPFIELAGSALPARDGGVARLRVQEQMRVRELFRVGGLELALGLELGVWLPRL
jgi:hypothetical protein